MSHTPVVVIGVGDGGRSAQDALRSAGVSDVVTLDDAPGRELLTSRFDDDTDTWLLTTADGATVRAGVVVAAGRPPQVPWLPDIAGRDDFLGESFHAAAWDRHFAAAGKRVAVVGTDATAGHWVPRLTQSAASVTVFAHPPRRFVAELPLPATRAKRWLARRLRPAPDNAPGRAASPIEAITPTGIRTADGAEHDADVIVYGTGFAIPPHLPDEALVGARGLTIRRAWRDGMEPYFGVACHGFPNYFFVTGPDAGAQARYIASCVGLMRRTGSTRIEVRRSSQQVFNERANVRPAQAHRVSSAFDLSSAAPEDDDTYDGAATLALAGAEHPVRVRLTGHLNPIDGQYHWQGTIFCSLPDEAFKRARTATLTVGARTVPARIVEQTPWGTHTVTGVGAPPYAPS